MLRRLLSGPAAALATNAIARAPPPPRLPLDELEPGPLVVSGYFGQVLGIGSAARSTATALRDAGFAPHLDDLARLAPLPLYAHQPFPASAPGGVWISHCNAPELQRLLYVHAAGSLAGRYRIGYWAWELGALPSAWTRAARALHEIWVPSRFVAEAVRASAPAEVLVRIMPHPTPDLRHVRPDRARFAVAEDAFLVLTMFDLRSTRARKNPDAALAAYLQAFPEPSGAAVFLCKVVGGDSAPDELGKLRERLVQRTDVRLLTEEFSDEAVWTLMASADVLLSLHRSEGYGLALAESMKLGRCVVATDWSGNTDFMDATCAVPIPYRLTPVSDPQARYGGADLTWAEADIEAASAALRELRANPERRRQLGARARERITRHEATFGAELTDAPWRALVSG